MASRRDFAQVTSVPRVVTILGQRYRVPRLSPRILGELDSWLRERRPNPMAEARPLILDPDPAIDQESRRQIWIAAVEASKYWPPPLESPEAERELYGTFEGLSYFLYTVLSRTTDGFTQEKAEDLAERILDAPTASSEIAKIVSIMGPGDLGDPKSRGEGETPRP